MPPSPAIVRRPAQADPPVLAVQVDAGAAPGDVLRPLAALLLRLAQAERAASTAGRTVTQTET